MTQIKKFAWYGSSVALAALMAVTLLVAGSQSAFAAASTTATTAGVAGGTAATLAVTDGELAAGEIVIFTIIGGTGTGSFTSGGGQSLACADDASGGAVTTCDRNTAAGTVTVQISGATAGTLLVQYAVFDGNDGAAGTTNGSSNVANVTINAPVSGVTLTRTPTSVAAAGGVSTITATVTNSLGQPATGVVTFATSLGNFTDGCSNAVPTQVCSATINVADGTEAGEVAGSAVVVLTGAGASGTANITATIGGQSGSTTVTFAGAVTAMTSSTQFDTNAATGVFAVATEVAAGSNPNATTIANGFRVRVVLTDAAGNPAGTVAPTATSTTAGVTFAACSAPTAGVSTCQVTAQPATAGTVVNYTVTSGSVTTTGSWTVGGTTPATITVNAPDIAPVSVGNITAEVKDASGNLIGDGTTVTMVVTAGSLLATTAQTASGTATFTYVSPGTAQAVNATALIGSVVGSDSFNVGAVTPPAGEGSFTGTIAASGVSIVSFDGGSVADLAAAAEEAGLISVWVTIEGDFVGYIVGAPAFVNAAFNAQFADGIDAGTLMIVVK